MSATDEDAVLSSVDEQDEVDDDDEVKVYPLTQKTISQGLSLLCRTGNGLAHAFVKLDIQNKRLNDITAISSYIHLRFVDASNNHLTDLSPLASLTQLLWLKADNNAVASFHGQPFALLRYLQWLSIATNHLMDLEGLVVPSLERLILTGNGIQRVKGLEGGCFANLVTLELRRNGLDTTDGINLPNLRHLYLAQNCIKRLEGLDKLERLTTLHLRDNKIDNLDGLSPNMTCLQYLNIRGNTIYEENSLRGLKILAKTLRILVISENPLGQTTDYRLSVLVLLPRLERIDKDPVSPEERADALERIKELKALSSKNA